jgi:hypothetical protein
MPLSALLTNLIPDDANPMGTDFVGGADLSGQALTGSSHLAKCWTVASTCCARATLINFAGRGPILP